MDFRDSKTQKIVIGILAFFIVAYFWYSRVYSRYNSQITTANQEFETITTNLRNVEMKAKSLDALRIEYTDLIERYGEIEQLLPEVKQVPSILVQLHTASSLTGTRVTKVIPKPNKSAEFYEIADFEIEMQGTFHDFGKFISYVANFPFIANISEMNIKTKKISVSAEKDHVDRKDPDKDNSTMTATFTLSTYFIKEQERLAELSF